MQRVKKGDTVKVIAGKDKGVTGEVLRVLPKENRVVVERVNILKKHQRPQQTGRGQIQPGIIEFEGPIHLSNVMPICPSCNQAVRVGFRYLDDGGKVRFCRKCNSDLD
jgi:large subunit ribosomal protein L24